MSVFMEDKISDEKGLSPKQLKKEKQKRRKAKNRLKGKRGKKLMPQALRLEKAKKWLEKYSGDNVLKAYRKSFAVDRMTTLNELTMLGLTFSEAQIEKEKRAVAHTEQIRKNKIAKRKAKKQSALNTEYTDPDQDDTFFYIAGRTSGGAPYGVTWAQMGLRPYEDVLDEKDGGIKES